MATIVIRDLDESVELDREAMRAVTGGARLPSAAHHTGVMPRADRVVPFPRIGNGARRAGDPAPPGVTRR